MSNDRVVKEINDAIGAHGSWKLRLRTAINTGRSDVTPEVAGCDDKCAFGAWLYGSTIDAATRAELPYQVIRRLHADFHRSAASVLALAVGGQKERAVELLEGDYTERSEKLARALGKWKREMSQAVLAG